MKILLIHNEYQQSGGEETVVGQEHRLLENAGHQVIPYRRSNWETESLTGVKRLGILPRMIWASDSRRDVLELLCGEKPDVVHVHNTFMVISPSIYSACFEAGVPVVQTLHNFRLFCPAAFYFRDGKVCEECTQYSLLRGIRYGCYRESRATTAAVAAMLASHRLLGTWHSKISAFIALTEFARGRFAAGGLPAGKIRVKPNFMDPDPGPRAGDGEYALFVGRLSPEKGVATILDAWSHLPKAIPLKIVGDGPLASALKSEAQQRGLSSVEFVGRLPREQTIDAMKRARFVLFPSLWYENFPMTIVEAFACATPVICSRLGAMAEIVRDGQLGMNFAVGDAQDLAAKSDWAWNHCAEMRSMGERARAEYQERYTPQRNYQLLMAIYEEALGRQRS